MKTQLIWTGGFLRTAEHTVLLRATVLVEDQLVSVNSSSQLHKGYREASKTLLAMVFPMSTTPLIPQDHLQNSASKRPSACSWPPQIFRPTRASLLLQPTVQSHLEETGTHTSTTTVAISRSCSVSHPVLTTADKTSPLCNSKTKHKQL